VLIETDNRSEGIKLDDLHVFGDEALLSGAVRDALIGGDYNVT